VKSAPKSLKIMPKTPRVCTIINLIPSLLVDHVSMLFFWSFFLLFLMTPWYICYF
jgi:hypothetical protein